MVLGAHFAMPHATLVLHHQPNLALLAAQVIIASLALLADLPALALTVTLISIIRPANLVQVPVYIVLKEPVTATIAFLISITNLITGIATPHAPRTPDTMLLLLKGDVFHAVILTAYLAIAMVIAFIASHSGNSIRGLDAARKDVQQVVLLAPPMELVFHASLAGPSTTTAKLALAHILAAINVVLLNVPPAKKVCG